MVSSLAYEAHILNLDSVMSVSEDCIRWAYEEPEVGLWLSWHLRGSKITTFICWNTYSPGNSLENKESRGPKPRYKPF